MLEAHPAQAFSQQLQLVVQLLLQLVSSGMSWCVLCSKALLLQLLSWTPAWQLSSGRLGVRQSSSGNTPSSSGADSERVDD